MRKQGHPRLGPKGFTLVEVVVAMLIIGLMSAMCLPVFLAGRMSAPRLERRVAAAESVQRLSTALESYVTADASLAQGPGGGADGWCLPGDRSGLRALEAGVHPLDPALWAGSLASYQPSLSYTVVVRRTPSGPQPDVNIVVAWSEP